MKTYFITAKTDIKIYSLICKNLKNADAEELLKAGSCWLDKIRITDKNHVVKAKQTVKVFISRRAQKKHTVTKENIIYEDQNIITVYKPCALNVQSDSSSKTNNLTFAVQEYLSEQKNSYIPTAITRLDLNVSGLVLFAKNKDTEKKLFSLTRERKIHKKYTAFLEKNTSNPARIMIKDRLSFKKSKAFNDDSGKKSKTLFLQDPANDTFQKYSVFLFTGRRHQIRFHAKTYLSPIIGDKKYGSKTNNQTIALTAAGLNFKLDKKKYRIRLPENFLAVPKQKEEI